MDDLTDAMQYAVQQGTFEFEYKRSQIREEQRRVYESFQRAQSYEEREHYDLRLKQLAHKEEQLKKTRRNPPVAVRKHSDPAQKAPVERPDLAARLDAMEEKYKAEMARAEVFKLKSASFEKELKQVQSDRDYFKKQCDNMRDGLEGLDHMGADLNKIQDAIGKIKFKEIVGYNR